VTGLAAATTFPFGEWAAAEAPVLSPQGTTWNPPGRSIRRLFVHGSKFVMLYRRRMLPHIALGYAESADGIFFTRRAEPVYREADYKKMAGGRPAAARLGDTYYLTYTGYNKKTAALPGTSQDLILWERKGVILPAYKGNWNRGWTKSGAMVPEKIAKVLDVLAR